MSGFEVHIERGKKTLRWLFFPPFHDILLGSKKKIKKKIQKHIHIFLNTVHLAYLYKKK